MSEDLFENLFGPSKAKPAQRKTRDELMADMLRGGSKWKAEAPVVALLEAFEGVVEAPRGQFMRKSWYAGARDFLEEHGEDCNLLVETARYMINKGMMVETPRACIKTARFLKRGRDDEGWRRSYLEGEL